MTVRSAAAGRQRVAVVTGGGGGIGAAIAEELGRSGVFVVTVDPLVSVDGIEQLPAPEETTAGRIIAAGGAARASGASVTDPAALHELFAGLAEEFGGLDAVVNVAGITRPTSFTRGSEDDWRDVLSVHLDGYRNVLAAALPIMAQAGSGHILGVTSGSGWRPADTGAYGCAKRAVASLTWQLGRAVPAGVVVNAISPIAMTRMVTAALSRHRASSPSSPSTPAAPASPSTPAGPSATGGLSLGVMPGPEELGPLAAHLVSEGFSTCQGQVLFVAGSEMAVIDEPRLLEVVPAEPVAGLAGFLDVAVSLAFASAEANQASSGGSNPRFRAAPDAATLSPPVSRTCVVVSDRDDLADAAVASLDVRGVRCHRIDAGLVPPGFRDAWEALTSGPDGDDVDAVVVALAATHQTVALDGWEHLLATHTAIVDHVHADATWARAVADLSARTGKPLRLVSITDAASGGGRSRAQASAQLARAALGATDQRVAAFAVALESMADTARRAAAELAAHLACSPESPRLSGAELVVGDATIGLRSHPRVAGSVALGGTSVPDWFDDVLGAIVSGGAAR